MHKVRIDTSPLTGCQVLPGDDRIPGTFSPQTYFGNIFPFNKLPKFPAGPGHARRYTVRRSQLSPSAAADDVDGKQNKQILAAC
jgi:hypothetical protein